MLTREMYFLKLSEEQNDTVHGGSEIWKIMSHSDHLCQDVSCQSVWDNLGQSLSQSNWLW